VLVSQVVQNVLAFPPPPDNIVGSEDAKTLRNYGDGLTFEVRQFRDAGLSLG